MDMRRFGDRARSRCCRSNMTHNIYVHQKISTFGELFCVSRTKQVGRGTSTETLDVQEGPPTLHKDPPSICRSASSS